MIRGRLRGWPSTLPCCVFLRKGAVQSSPVLGGSKPSPRLGCHGSSSHALRKWLRRGGRRSFNIRKARRIEFARPGISSGSWCFRAGKGAEKSGDRAASKLRESGDRLQCVRVSARERVRKAVVRCVESLSMGLFSARAAPCLAPCSPPCRIRSARTPGMAIGAAHHGRPSRFLKTAGCQGCWRRSAPRVNMRQVRRFETAVPRRTHPGPEEHRASGA